jgi:hypothetical protein
MLGVLKRAESRLSLCLYLHSSCPRFFPSLLSSTLWLFFSKPTFQDYALPTSKAFETMCLVRLAAQSPISSKDEDAFFLQFPAVFETEKPGAFSLVVKLKSGLLYCKEMLMSIL